MTKEIRVVDAERRIVQITSVDERWYSRPSKDAATGIDKIEFRPSVTFICSHYPKGPGFYQWAKDNGDEADKIARLAADRGYKVHLAVAWLNKGETITWATTRFLDPTSGTEELLTTEEYAGALSYVDWWNTEGRHKYRIVACEYVTWPDPKKLSEDTNWPAAAFEFAGTVDLKVEQIDNGSFGIIDFATSKDLWPSKKMQTASYAVAEGADWAACLQLNYARNKKQKWKFTPVDVKHWFRLFMSTKNIWNEENEGIQPLQRDYPLEVSLNLEPPTA